MIDSDGSITIGSLQAGLGLVSRRSEMQAAEEQIENLQMRYLQAKSTLEQTQQEHHIASEKVRSTEKEVFDTQRNVESIHERMLGRAKRSEELHDELLAKQSAIFEHESQRSSLLDLLSQRKLALEKLHDQSQAILETLAQTENEFEELELLSRTSQSELVDKRVAAARLEQRIDGLRTTLKQLLNDTHERNHHVQDANDGLQSLANRIAEITDQAERLREELSDEDQQLVELQFVRLMSCQTTKCDYDLLTAYYFYL